MTPDPKLDAYEQELEDAIGEAFGLANRVFAHRRGAGKNARLLAGGV